LKEKLKGRSSEKEKYLEACNREYSVKECYLKALEYNPMNAKAWVGLCERLTSEVSETTETDSRGNLTVIYRISFSLFYKANFFLFVLQSKFSFSLFYLSIE